MATEFDDEYQESTLESIERAEAIVASFNEGASLQDGLKELRMIIHSIKGTSSIFGYPFAGEVCHAIEDFLEISDEMGESQVKKIQNMLDIIYKYMTMSFEDEQSDDVLNSLKQRLAAIHISDSSKDFKVLLAEPSEIISKILSKQLKEHGYQVSLTKSGLDALNRILREPVDAIVASAILEHISGEELFRILDIIDKDFSKVKKILISSDKKEQHDSDLVRLVKNSQLSESVLKCFEQPPQDQPLSLPDNICYIDDDEMLLGIVNLVFEKGEQSPPKCAQTIDDGIDLVHKEKPELVLLDYYIGDKTGHQFIHDYSDTEEPPPVIFLTGKTTKCEADYLSEPCVIGVIAKPFETRYLLQQISQIWTQYQQKQKTLKKTS